MNIRRNGETDEQFRSRIIDFLLENFSIDSIQSTLRNFKLELTKEEYERVLAKKIAERELLRRNIPEDVVKQIMRKYYFGKRNFKHTETGIFATVDIPIDTKIKYCNEIYKAFQCKKAISSRRKKYNIKLYRYGGKLWFKTIHNIKAGDKLLCKF